MKRSTDRPRWKADGVSVPPTLWGVGKAWLLELQDNKYQLVALVVNRTQAERLADLLNKSEEKKCR